MNKKKIHLACPQCGSRAFGAYRRSETIKVQHGRAVKVGDMVLWCEGCAWEGPHADLVAVKYA